MQLIHFGMFTSHLSSEINIKFAPLVSILA